MFSEISFFPAEDIHVALYLVHLVQSGKTQSTVNSSYYGINYFHDLYGAANPCQSSFVKNVFEGAMRTAPKGQQRIREPILSDDLKVLVNKFGGQDATLIDIRDVTMCLLAFAAFLRFDEISFLKWSHVKFYESYFSLYIPKSKTDQRKIGKTVVVAKSGKVTCPYTMLYRFKSLCYVGENCEDYIFSKMQFYKSIGNYKPRAGDSISQTRCREVILSKLKSSGVDTQYINLHSFRIGGASAACNNNVADSKIQKHGRWASKKSKDQYCRYNLKRQLELTLSIDI